MLQKSLYFDGFSAVLGHVNVAPRHLTAEAETLLLATLIHEVFSKEFSLSNIIQYMPSTIVLVIGI